MKKLCSLMVAGALALLLTAGCGGGGGGGGVVLPPNPTYTVTYNGNGNTSGSVPTDATNYEQGQTVTVLGNTGTLVKTGYSFAGWNTQADGNGTTYTPAQTFAMGSANVTLYAKWTANPTYTVTYNGNGNTGGSVPTDATNYEQGQTVTVLGNTGSLVKSGYTFAGWNTQADGNGTTYAQAQTFAMVSANVILYTKWTTPPVPDTGQTGDYTTTFGEDSDYTINPPSYTDNGDGTILDNVTGLTWQKCSVGQNNDATCSGTAATYNWFQATGTADATYNPSGATNVCGNLSLAGPGWRLPTVFELMTIVNYGTYSAAINSAYFPNTLSWFYWSSTVYAPNTPFAWYVVFYDGHANRNDKTNSDNVRCVRGEQAPSNFTDNGNGTVTDTVTGLMWQKQDDATGRTWEQAISYCEDLSLGGFTDWRLPNIKELGALVDFTKATSPVINTTYFPGTQSSYYWSSTTYVSGSTSAWYVQFSNVGGVGSLGNKADFHYARCVRSGQ